MQLKKKYGNCNKNIATWNQKTLHTDIFFDSFIGCSCALTSVLTSPILFSPSIAVAPPSWLSFIKRGFRRSGSVLKSCTTTGGASISHASAVGQPGAHLDASRETSVPRGFPARLRGSPLCHHQDDQTGPHFQHGSLFPHLTFSYSNSH